MLSLQNKMFKLLVILFIIKLYALVKLYFSVSIPFLSISRFVFQSVCLSSKSKKVLSKVLKLCRNKFRLFFTLFIPVCNKTCANWSEMVEIIFPDIKPSSVLFKNILSMSVFKCDVTRVGLWCKGEENLYTLSLKMLCCQHFYHILVDRYQNHQLTLLICLLLKFFRVNLT